MVFNMLHHYRSRPSTSMHYSKTVDDEEDLFSSEDDKEEEEVQSPDNIGK